MTNTTNTTTKTPEAIIVEINKTNSTDLLPALQEAIKQENLTRMTKKLNQILALKADKKALFNELITNGNYKILAKKQDNEGVFSLVEKTAQISFKRLEKEYQKQCGTMNADGTINADTSKTLANSKKYAGYFEKFINNMLLNKVEKGELNASVTSKLATYKDENFANYSIVALEKQINLVASEILPTVMPCKLLKCHVKEMLQLVIKLNNDSSASKLINVFSKTSESKLYDCLFRCINEAISNKKCVLEVKEVKQAETTVK